MGRFQLRTHLVKFRLAGKRQNVARMQFNHFFASCRSTADHLPERNYSGSV
jgi:hypothetical protein